MPLAFKLAKLPSSPTPNPILPLQLEIFYIMDRDWAKENNTQTATNVKGGEEGNFANMNANGTGPYMVKSRQPDVKTVLVPNPDWWGNRESNVTEAVFTPIGQDATRVAALLAGDVDMAYPVPVQDWERLKAAEGVNPLTGPEARTIFLGFDQLRDELLYSSVKGKKPLQGSAGARGFLEGHRYRSDQGQGHEWRLAPGRLDGGTANQRLVRGD